MCSCPKKRKKYSRGGPGACKLCSCFRGHIVAPTLATFLTCECVIKYVTVSELYQYKCPFHISFLHMWTRASTRSRLAPPRALRSPSTTPWSAYDQRPRVGDAQHGRGALHLLAHLYLLRVHRARRALRHAAARALAVAGVRLRRAPVAVDLRALLEAAAHAAGRALALHLVRVRVGMAIPTAREAPWQSHTSTPPARGLPFLTSASGVCAARAAASSSNRAATPRRCARRCSLR